MSPPNRRDEGSTLVFAAITMGVILVFSAIAIDVGVIATARSQLQGAVDASSLAGASGLFISQDDAIQRAITFAGLNDCINNPVVIAPDAVSFPEESRVRVEVNHEIDLYFARIIGRSTQNIHAVAEAELGTLSGTGAAKPWAIPDFDYVLGELVLLKSGSSDPPSASTSFFYCVDFPPLNKGTPITGADKYRENIVEGSDSGFIIEIGDNLQVETGNMVGPTAQGVREIIAQDPNASWDLATNTIQGSLFPEFTSPRVCKIAMYDYNHPPNPGRNYVTVIRLGAFFVEEIAPGNDVMGRFIEITTSGPFGPGDSDLLGVRLVR